MVQIQELPLQIGTFKSKVLWCGLGHHPHPFNIPRVSLSYYRVAFGCCLAVRTEAGA